MKNKGVTLLELLIVIALIAVIIPIMYSFGIFGIKTHKISMDEFDIQSSSRIFADNVNNITRFATSTHTVPKSSFQDSNHRDPSWSYIGINSQGNVVLDEPGDSKDSPRKVTIIAEKKDGIEYSVKFLPVYKDGKRHDTLMHFVIEGYKNNNKVINMVSEVEVMNSLQIEHKGSLNDPAVALSYTKIDRNSPEFINISPDAHVAMVIDTSGSMDWAMGGSNESGDKRINILKIKAKEMISKLSNMGFDIYVTVVPFSDNANEPSQIYNINKNNPNNNIASINAFIDALEADGATNTGDGLRRAYYQLQIMGNNFMSKPENASLDPTKKYSYFTQHLMVLVDGETNRETTYGSWNNHWFWGWRYTSDGLYTGSDLVGTGGRPNIRSLSVSNRNRYVDEIGNKLIKNLKYINKDGISEQVIKSFVIGFSAKSEDHVSLDNIGIATNGKEFVQKDTTIKKFIIATDAEELDFAFGSFTEEVSASLWSIYGPTLE